MHGRRGDGSHFRKVVSIRIKGGDEGGWGGGTGMWAMSLYNCAKYDMFRK
jgi:hypothetical protein